MKFIPLTRGEEATVSDCDYDFLMQWKWYCTKEPRPCRSRRKSDGEGTRSIFLYHVVASRMNLNMEGLKVEHKDRNPLNNQRENLRPATQGQNTFNKGKCGNNTSGYKGVHWNKKNQRWVAEIWANGVKRCCGSFSNPEEAAAAYDRDARVLHGDFACLNGSGAKIIDGRGTWRHNTSGYRGVTWDKVRKKWIAQFQICGKHHHLGRFTDQKDAARAYNTAALLYFGPNAYQNKLGD